MLNTLLRPFGILVVAGVAAAPLVLNAQVNPKAAAPGPAAIESAAPSSPAKKATAGPFRGKLAALDKKAKTITVGKRTFQVTSSTKMSRNGKPATLEDGVVGEICSGYVKPNEEGKLCASTINFGPKADAKTPAQGREPVAKNKAKE